jgi:hypothetical protein
MTLRHWLERWSGRDARVEFRRVIEVEILSENPPSVDITSKLPHIKCRNGRH